jgi:hypothetical protein
MRRTAWYGDTCRRRGCAMPGIISTMDREREVKSTS